MPRPYCFFDRTSVTASRKPRTCETIKVLVAPDEKAMLERAASDSGLSVSTFMRMAALELARERGYAK